MTSSLLKSVDVARLLQVHPKHIYRLLARGLPAHRVGSEWRFSREEVLAWSGVPESRAETPAAREDVPPLLAANGDLVIEILIACLIARDAPLVGFVQLDRGRALARLAKRAVLLAAFHGAVPPSHADSARLARIHLVARDIGLAVPRGSRLRRLRDIARKRVALRPASAGVRAHFDAALEKERVTLGSLKCKTTLFDSHREAVCAVLRGEADVALTTSAWAERVGLGFFPLASEPYDLLVHADNLGTPVSVAVCEVAQSGAFRKALGKIAGYDPKRAGEIRYGR
jgi:putative molybdopterin biosynthesis protein